VTAPGYQSINSCIHQQIRRRASARHGASNGNAIMRCSVYYVYKAIYCFPSRYSIKNTTKIEQPTFVSLVRAVFPMFSNPNIDLFTCLMFAVFSLQNIHFVAVSCVCSDWIPERPSIASFVPVVFGVLAHSRNKIVIFSCAFTPP
jgi:hypothetical protein